MGAPCCPMCGRVLGDVNIDEHHLVPKTFKGRETVTLHRICHRKIHSVLSERELLHHYHTMERIVEHSDIASFIKWVQRQEPSYYDGSKETADRKSKRRR